MLPFPYIQANDPIAHLRPKHNLLYFLVAIGTGDFHKHENYDTMNEKRNTPSRKTRNLRTIKLLAHPKFSIKHKENTMPLPIILWGLGAAVAAYAGKKGYDYYSEEKEKEEREDRARKEREQEELISKAKRTVEAFESIWGKRFESLLLVDSNIWMNRVYENFFKDLEWVMGRFESKIKMSSVQFDEMINLKNLPYENPKSRLARCALARIEYFQNIDLIEIIPMGLDAKKNAYADPDIIEILVDSLASHSAMTLVSDDRELRIRANQILKNKQAPDFKSITGEDIHEEMKNYQSSVQILS